MKKYIMFSAIFIFLFSLFQILSGMLLTLLYTPDMTAAWSLSVNQSQKVMIQGSSYFIIPLCIAFLSAIITYYFTEKMIATKA